ncbi:MAG: anion permease [Planctomycetaceae bacterium]|nr:anion permease [Planctomycetaceae bacterium]
MRKLVSLPPGLAKVLCLVVVTFGITSLAHVGGFDPHQIASVAVFTMLITSTALFYEFHLAFAFLGVSAMLLMNVLNLQALAEETKLDVVIFLMGMMIIVGVLKDLGLFSWIITRVLSREGLTARGFMFTACVLGMIMSCLVDEMAAVVFVLALIFQVADVLDIKPVPFVIMAVMSINIGSAGTMLGNPVGILIGQGANPPLSFNDFMIWSFPLMLVEFAVALVLMFYLHRRDIALMNQKLQERREAGLTLAPMVRVPHGWGLAVLAALLAMLILHKVIERALGLPPNTMLITAPLLLAALCLLWRRQRIKKYLEEDVDWGVSIFLLMLFMIAGALERTGTTDRVAEYMVQAFGDTTQVLIPAVLGVSTLMSAFVENIVFVAAFIPIVNKFDQTPLLWALLHGACLGGNITMVGSTANIVAVGMMEKRYWTTVHFVTWLKTGILVGLASCLVAWAGLALLAPEMPTREERVQSMAGVAGTGGEEHE